MMLRQCCLVLVCVSLCLPFPLGAQSPKTPNAVTAKSQFEAVAAVRSPRYERSNGPDPFLNPLVKRKNGDVDEEVPKNEPPPGIAGMNIKEVDLMGISSGAEGRTAAFRGTDQRVYFLHEGARLFDGFVKAIDTSSVVLTRETRLRSGKVLTQEITKRLRN